MSHLYYQALPPLFIFLVVELDTSYTALGLIMTVYHLASATTTTPIGFIVDRVGPRRMLVIGLVVQAMAIILAGFYNSYWSLMVLFGISGLAFAVYHPANYAIMSGSIDRSKLGRAFSVHAFSGNMGNALTPIIVLAIAGLWGWQTAFFIIGPIGLVVALLIHTQGDVLRGEAEARRDDPENVGTTDAAPRPTLRQDFAVLLSAPVLLCFLFYVISNISIGGVRTYGVAALVELYGTPATVAGGVLTGYMIGASAGILTGGFFADRFGARIMIPVIGLTGAAVMMFVVGTISMPIVMITALLVISGYLRGCVQATRDLIVLSITPRGSTGKVFAFVYNGSMIGGALVPFIYGGFMDAGTPEAVFWIAGCAILLALLTFSGVARLASGGQDP
jgi:sugar phosphate permease